MLISKLIMEIDMQKENELAKTAVNIAYKIHVQYGAGLFESVYEEILCFELGKGGLCFTRQQPIPVVHESIKLNAGFRADVIIESKLLLEIKSIDSLALVHYKQVQTYLKLTGLKLGLLINFNVAYLKEGIKRVINSY